MLYLHCTIFRFGMAQPGFHSDDGAMHPCFVLDFPFIFRHFLSVGSKAEKKYIGQAVVWTAAGAPQLVTFQPSPALSRWKSRRDFRGAAHFERHRRRLQFSNFSLFLLFPMVFILRLCSRMPRTILGIARIPTYRHTQTHGQDSRGLLFKLSPRVPSYRKRNSKTKKKKTQN